MNTVETIRASLAALGIESWLLNENTVETAELFFVKKQLDTRRIKDTHKFSVTVYHDKDGLRGCTTAELLASDSEETVRTKLSDAYSAAQYAMNPFYALPDPVQAPMVRKTGALASDPLAVSAGKIAGAIFAPDTREDAFVNSAEVFITRFTVRILSSAGTDVSYTNARAEGEYVVQCLAPEDVELHRCYELDECDTETLTKQVSEALGYVSDRAKAQKALKSGKYDLVLCGEHTAEVLSYYCERASAQMIYSHYSTWQVGDKVQGETKGEALDLTLCATAPYSAEGIAMKDRALLRAGSLEGIFGGNRFCRYLDIEPTGNYRKFRCENPGSESLAEMKKRPCLVAVDFSDFQMDSLSGHFGGEIRLAYLIDGESVLPVTGGSVNGSILETQSDMSFSTDRYSSAKYDGPYAILMKNVNVAGCAD